MLLIRRCFKHSSFLPHDRPEHLFFLAFGGTYIGGHPRCKQRRAPAKSTRPTAVLLLFKRSRGEAGRRTQINIKHVKHRKNIVKHVTMYSIKYYLCGIVYKPLQKRCVALCCGDKPQVLRMVQGPEGLGAPSCFWSPKSENTQNPNMTSQTLLDPLKLRTDHPKKCSLSADDIEVSSTSLGPPPLPPSTLPFHPSSCPSLSPSPPISRSPRCPAPGAHRPAAPPRRRRRAGSAAPSPAAPRAAPRRGPRGAARRRGTPGWPRAPLWPGSGGRVRTGAQSGGGVERNGVGGVGQSGCLFKGIGTGVRKKGEGRRKTVRVDMWCGSKR